MRTRASSSAMLSGAFAPGERWTFTSANGDVRTYAIDSFNGVANVYKLYNVETFPDGPPEGWSNRGAAWASRAWLSGSPRGWAKAA